MTDLVKRLRDWQHVHPEDQDKPEGSLYIEAADRIEELEAKLANAVVALDHLGFDWECEAGRQIKEKSDD